MAFGVIVYRIKSHVNLMTPHDPTPMAAPGIDRGGSRNMIPLPPRLQVPQVVCISWSPQLVVQNFFSKKFQGATGK